MLQTEPTGGRGEPLGEVQQLLLVLELVASARSGMNAYEVEQIYRTVRTTITLLVNRYQRTWYQVSCGSKYMYYCMSPGHRYRLYNGSSAVVAFYTIDKKKLQMRYNFS